jgi:hypothetical protein
MSKDYLEDARKTRPCNPPRFTSPRYNDEETENPWNATIVERWVVGPLWFELLWFQDVPDGVEEYSVLSSFDRVKSCSPSTESCDGGLYEHYKTREEGVAAILEMAEEIRDALIDELKPRAIHVYG